MRSPRTKHSDSTAAVFSSVIGVGGSSVSSPCDQTFVVGSNPTRPHAVTRTSTAGRMLVWYARMTDAELELSFYEKFLLGVGIEPYPVQEQAIDHIFAGKSVL